MNGNSNSGRTREQQHRHAPAFDVTKTLEAASVRWRTRDIARKTITLEATCVRNGEAGCSSQSGIFDSACRNATPALQMQKGIFGQISQGIQVFVIGYGNPAI
jgi:hypothetical protein